ncbi:MAG: glycosyltransferase family 4 protein [Mobilitalea sp.]
MTIKIPENLLKKVNIMKTKILFIGDYDANNGPSNVNKNILKYLKINHNYIIGKNKFIQVSETIWKIICSDIIVCSGITTIGRLGIRFTKLLGKKTIYIMHGCLEYENKINELGLSDKKIKNEKSILYTADLILGVSETYMNWLKNRFPIYKDKIYYLTNGLEQVDFNILKEKTFKYQVVVMGGDRIQKNNIQVCEAVEKLNKKGIGEFCTLIFGRISSSTNVFKKYPHATYKGQVSQKELYDYLAQSDIFVLNSDVESFGLSVVDALNCNCNILISKNAGICSALELNKNDLIYCTKDIDEIADKIIDIINNPNFMRIKKTIDYDNLSWEKVSIRLEKIAKALSNNLIKFNISED